MTPAQSDRLRGWNASVLRRGVPFTYNGESATGLLRHMDAGLETFVVGPQQDMNGEIHLLREDFERMQIPLLATVEGSDRRWLVKRIEDNPVSIVVILHCILDDGTGNDAAAG